MTKAEETKRSIESKSVTLPGVNKRNLSMKPDFIR